MQITRRSVITSVAAVICLLLGRAADAASAREIRQDSSAALEALYASSPKAREFAKLAKGVLVFPKIVKAGFLVGAQSGDGVLRVNGKVAGYYNISAASFGLQAGAQTFSYALFFMNQRALDYLTSSNGWQIGSGPSIVVVNKGAAASMTSTTLGQDVYAFPFAQTGLMAGLGLEGSKITRIRPDP